MPDGHEILSRTEVLGLLSQKAREGSTSAMIALERALRIGADEAPDEDDFIERLRFRAGEGGTRGGRLRQRPAAPSGPEATRARSASRR
jgi:hypothetical protein